MGHLTTEHTTISNNTQSRVPKHTSPTLRAWPRFCGRLITARALDPGLHWPLTDVLKYLRAHRVNRPAPLGPRSTSTPTSHSVSPSAEAPPALAYRLRRCCVFSPPKYLFPVRRPLGPAIFRTCSLSPCIAERGPHGLSTGRERARNIRASPASHLHLHVEDTSAHPRARGLDPNVSTPRR